MTAPALFVCETVPHGYGIRLVPAPIYGQVILSEHIQGEPCGYDIKTLADGRKFTRPDTYSNLSPYDWKEIK